MTEDDLRSIGQWLVEQGLAGTSEQELMRAFCARCRDAGLSFSHALVLIDTLHPVYEGRGFRWRDDSDDVIETFDYGRTIEGEQAERWRRSPFSVILEAGSSEWQCRIDSPEADPFWSLMDLRPEGHTDYVAFVHRFAGESVIGEMDCVYSHWCKRTAGGFDAAERAALRRLIPGLALAVKCAALTRIAATLVEVYLGRDAGRRVLSGRISRGIPDRITAVLWFSDLRGYTAISDVADPGEIIPLLNDYAEATISAIHAAGGEVLKLIGDGTLALFAGPDARTASRAALLAEHKLRRRAASLRERRGAEGRPTSSVYVGLHIGEVFYGNIGSEDRLDFTVVGPAVNEVSRIASMCRSADRDILVSASFREALEPSLGAMLVSVGRYALRGVGRAQDLYTIDPEILDHGPLSEVFRRRLHETAPQTATP